MHVRKVFLLSLFAAFAVSAQDVGAPTVSSLTPADSGWLAKSWTLEAGYSNGMIWGDLQSAESDMADRVGLTVESYGVESKVTLVLLEEYKLGFGVWRNVSSRTDLGVSYRHGWTLLVAGQTGFDLLVSSNMVSVQARHWFFRRKNFELGLYGAVGPSIGTIYPYPLITRVEDENGVPVSGSNWRLDAVGWRFVAGPAMEVMIFPQFVLGGVFQITREAWSIESGRAKAALYPDSPVSWEIGLDLHLGYRF